MSDIKILLLCNNKIAFPALRELLFYKQVAAIIIPSANKEVIASAKELTENLQVEVITADRKNFSQKIKDAVVAYKPAAALVMTFPYIITPELITLLPKGFINFHYGRLPEYRGPEPIFAQVKNREMKPGLAVHVVTDGVDCGPVIVSETVSFSEDDTYGMLRNKLAGAGAKVVSTVMKILSFGSIVPATPQDESKATYYQKPSAADLMIDWQTMDSAAIKALVNACNPWNKGCGTRLHEQVIGITEVEIRSAGELKEKPGTIVMLDNEKGLGVFTCDNKVIKVNIIYTEEGFKTGSRLTETGIKAGDIFS